MDKLLACLVFSTVWTQSWPLFLCFFPTIFLFSKSWWLGHGGSRAAEYLREHLFENLLKHPDFFTDTKLAISNFSLQLHCRLPVAILVCAATCLSAKIEIYGKKQAKHIRKQIQISWNQKQALLGMMVQQHQLQFWWVTICMLQMLAILVLLFQNLAKVLHTGSRYFK